MGCLLGFWDCMIEPYKFFIYLILNGVPKRKREHDDDVYDHIRMMAFATRFPVPMLSTIMLLSLLAMVRKKLLFVNPVIFQRLLFFKERMRRTITEKAHEFMMRWWCNVCSELKLNRLRKWVEIPIFLDHYTNYNIHKGLTMVKISDYVVVGGVSGEKCEVSWVSLLTGNYACRQVWACIQAWSMSHC